MDVRMGPEPEFGVQCRWGSKIDDTGDVQGCCRITGLWVRERGGNRAALGVGQAGEELAIALVPPSISGGMVAKGRTQV